MAYLDYDGLTRFKGHIDDSIEASLKPVEAHSGGVSGYKLLATGLSKSDSSYQLLKYEVIPGEKIYIKAAEPESGDGSFQFQSSYNASSSSTAAIIGETYTTAADGEYTVPAGATWLIISALKTDTESGAFRNVIDNVATINNAFPQGLSALWVAGLSNAEKRVTSTSRTITVNGNVIRQRAPTSTGSSTYRTFAVIKNGAIKEASNRTNLLAALEDSDFIQLPATNGRYRLILSFKAQTSNGSNQYLPVFYIAYKDSESVISSYEIVVPSQGVSSYSGIYTVDLSSLMSDNKFLLLVTTKQALMEFDAVCNIVLDEASSINSAFVNDGGAWEG